MSDLQTAQAVLAQFDCQKPPSDVGFEALRAALLQVVAASDYQLLGICADSVEAAKQALVTYTAALGYQPAGDLPALSGAVYVKFNGRSSGCYAEPYGGTSRGVLVSCQSAADGVNQTFGPLPLDLFEISQ